MRARLFGSILASFRRRAALRVEILALRHQLEPSACSAMSSKLEKRTHLPRRSVDLICFESLGADRCRTGASWFAWVALVARFGRPVEPSFVVGSRGPL